MLVLGLVLSIPRDLLHRHPMFLMQIYQPSASFTAVRAPVPFRDVFDRHGRRRRGRTAASAVVLLWATALSGCGGSSTSDLIERAAARRRPPDPAEATAQMPAPSPTTPVPVKPAPAVAAAVPLAAQATPTVIAPTEPPAAETPAIPPIADRRPTQRLSETERRQRAMQNIEKIGRALRKYIEDKQLLPARGTQPNGAALSWRVALLPYLGHQELYEQFDLSEPWNAPRHLELLQQIPDEYVSPERFDEKTNYLAVAGHSYAFGDRPVRVSRVEDGLENTVVVVEADDALAVPWTKPDDYAPRFDELRQGLGGLRGEGNYALWGNGSPTLLTTGLSQQQLHNAFTVEAGDGQMAAAIHQPVDDEPPTDASKQKTQLAVVESRETPLSIPANVPAARSAGATLERVPVPTAVQLSASSAQLRSLYAEQIGAARTPSQQAALAGEWLQQATAMTADRAGAFSLLKAAEQLAVQAADVALATEVIDVKIAVFDVDPYRVNADLLLALSRASGGPRSQTFQVASFAKRAVYVIDAALQQDDYATAASIASAIAQLCTAGQHRPLRLVANRMRAQLSAARGHYGRVGEAVVRLRNNPSDAEASANVGIYMCFFKGDWDRGLELLGQGSIVPLAAVALQDQSKPSSPTEMMAVADAWWQLSEQATQDVYRQACQERAVYWYRQAHALLPVSLDKLHAQRRIDSADASEAGSPAASLNELAQQLGVDLEQNLLVLATERRRK